MMNEIKCQKPNWIMLELGIEPLHNSNGNALLVKRVVSLNDVARQMHRDQSYCQETYTVDHCMNSNIKLHAKHADEDQTESGNAKPRTFNKFIVFFIIKNTYAQKIIKCIPLDSSINIQHISKLNLI